MARRNQLLSDLVRDSKIETDFIKSDVVEHVFYETGRSARHRRVRNVERWTKGRQLGQGAYGTVHLHTCQDGGVIKARAVKEVKKFVIAGKELDYASELEAIMEFSHSKYRHCFVISDGWYELDDTIFITMEYFELGDLQQHIAVPLPESETVQIVDQILEGLEFMHDNSFIHRDLKPANIIVVDKSPEWFVKIADFGISRRRHNDTTSLTIQLGTLGFVAPEVIGSDSDRSYTYSVDMWSLGAMTYRILTSKMVFQGLDGMFKYVLGNAEFPVAALKSHSVSEKGADFILSLMQPDPGARPSAKSATNHLWIASPLISDREKESSNLGIINHQRPAETGISTASKMWSMASGSNQHVETMRQQNPSPVLEQSLESTDDEISDSASCHSNELDSENKGQTSHQMVIRQREPNSKSEQESPSGSNTDVESESEHSREVTLPGASGSIKRASENAELSQDASEKVARKKTNYRSPYVEAYDDDSSVASKLSDKHTTTEDEQSDNSVKGSNISRKRKGPRMPYVDEHDQTLPNESSCDEETGIRVTAQSSAEAKSKRAKTSREKEHKVTHIESSKDEHLSSSKLSHKVKPKRKERESEDPSDDDNDDVPESNSDESGSIYASKDEKDKRSSANCMICNVSEGFKSVPPRSLRGILECLHGWPSFPKLKDEDFDQHFCFRHGPREDAKTIGNRRLSELSAIKHIQAQKNWEIMVKSKRVSRQYLGEDNPLNFHDVVCCSCPREFSGHRAPFLFLPCRDCRGFICRNCHSKASGVPRNQWLGRSAHRALLRSSNDEFDDSNPVPAPSPPLDGGYF